MTSDLVLAQRPAPASTARRTAGPAPRRHGWPPAEFWFCLALVILMNLATPAAWWAFQPAAVAGGQWWRVATFPFAHIGGYHLALDAGVFLFMLGSWNEPDWRRRLVLLAGSQAGALLAILAATPEVAACGLRGLSGPAHGLLAVQTLEWLRRARREHDRPQLWLGILLFAGLAAKCGWEALTGRVVCAGLHWGDIGTPLAACHAGGMLGALLAWTLLDLRPASWPMTVMHFLHMAKHFFSKQSPWPWRDKKHVYPQHT